MERLATDQMLHVILKAGALPPAAAGDGEGARDLRAMLLGDEARSDLPKLEISFSSASGQFVCRLVHPDGQNRVVRGWRLDDCLEWMHDAPDYKHPISLDENGCGSCDECHGEGVRFAPLRDDECEPASGRARTTPGGIPGALVVCRCRRPRDP